MTNPTPIDRITAFRRTIAPNLVAAVLLLLGEWGIDLDLTDKPMTLIIAYFALSTVIYLAAVLLGKRWPWIERALLSSAQQPTYIGGTAASPDTH